MDDRQWQNIMSDWQSCDITSQTPDIDDLETLKEKTRKKSLRMKCFMLSDLIGGFVAIVVMLLLFWQETDFLKQIVFLGCAAFMAPVSFLSYWYRRGAWETSGTDTHAYIALALKRSESGIKLANLCMYASLLVLPFIITMIYLRAMSFEGQLEWPINRFTIGMLLECLIFGGLYVGARKYRRARIRESEHLKSILTQLD